MSHDTGEGKKEEKKRGGYFQDYIITALIYPKIRNREIQPSFSYFATLTFLPSVSKSVENQNSNCPHSNPQNKACSISSQYKVVLQPEGSKKNLSLGCTGPLPQDKLKASFRFCPSNKQLLQQTRSTAAIHMEARAILNQLDVVFIHY